MDIYNSSVNRFSQKKQKDTLPKGLTFFRDTHHHDANALHKFTHQKRFKSHKSLFILQDCIKDEPIQAM
ncbi:hypothetical protein ED146_17025 [Escherichia coli]|nr:hypothetical protein [Escherichia coli]